MIAIGGSVGQTVGCSHVHVIPRSAGGPRPQCPLAGRKEVLDRYTDVSGDLAEQDGRDVSAGVHRNGGHTAIGMAELLVGV